MLGSSGGGVRSLNGITGQITLTAGTNVTITQTSQNNLTISSTGGSTSPLTTKGDLYTYSSMNTRLGVGTDGQILSADSTQATGLKWITNPGGSPAGNANSVQYNNAGSFGGAAEAYVQGNYFGVGISNTTGVVNLSYVLQVNGGVGMAAATSPSGTISYYSPPTPPTSASATATYFIALPDPSSPSASQVDGSFPGYYLADGTVSLTFYFAAYQTVDGEKIFSTGAQSIPFTDNSDASNFYIQLGFNSVSGASGYVIWRNGTYNGNTATYQSIDLGNATTYQDDGYSNWGSTIAHPPSPNGLTYAATGQTSDYKIYDYTVPVGSTKLFSTTFKSLSFTDDGRSQQPPPSGSISISTSGGSYVSAGTTHSYLIFSEYADGGYSSTALSKSITDSGPITVADPTWVSITQDPAGNGYSANGSTYTYYLVAYRSVGGGQYVFSPGTASISATDDNSGSPFQWDLVWTASPNADGYILFLYGGQNSAVYWSYDVGSGTTFDDSNNVTLNFPYPMNSVADPTFSSTPAQNDVESGYGPSDGSYSFTYYLGAYFSTGRGTIYSPGSVNAPFTDSNDGSPNFGIDMSWNAVTSSNGISATGYIVWVQGTSSGPQHPSIVSQSTGSTTSLNDQNNAWGSSYAYPPESPSSHAYAYETQLSWTAAPTAIGYYIIKTGGPSGPSYPIYISQAGTSLTDTDSSIWTASATNPPTPVELSTTYDIHVNYSGATGSPSDYRVLRQFNGGGYNYSSDFSGTSFIDGNYSFSWGGPASVTNTLYLATGATQSAGIYGYSSTLGIYSSSAANTSVTDNNSGEYYSVSWTATPPSGADHLKFIINTSNGELLATGSLPFIDVASGYNSNVTVTPTSTSPTLYSDASGNETCNSLTSSSFVSAATYVSCAQIGTGTGILQLGFAASSGGTNDITCGYGASTPSVGGGDNIAVGTNAQIQSNSSSCIAFGQLALIGTGLGLSMAGGYNASISGSQAVAWGPNTIVTATGASAWGSGSKAYGTGSVAIAGGNAQGGWAVSIGRNTEAQQHGVAIGDGSITSLSNFYGVSIGYSNTSGSGIALGINCTASSFGSFGAGQNVNVSNSNYNFGVGVSLSIGTSADQSIIFGQSISIGNGSSSALAIFGGIGTSSLNSLCIGNSSSIGNSASSSSLYGASSLIHNSSNASGIFGYNNSIAASCSNSYIFGASNSIAHAGVYILGSGISSGATNTLYIGLSGSVGIQMDNSSNVTFPGKVTSYKGISTAGFGLSPVVASADTTGQTSAVNPVCTFTPGSNGTFEVGGYLTVTAVATDVITLEVTYTDETNTGRTLILLSGISTTGVNNASSMTIRAKAANAITVKTVLTVSSGSITYDVGAWIRQIA